MQIRDTIHQGSKPPEDKMQITTRQTKKESRPLNNTLNLTDGVCANSISQKMVLYHFNCGRVLAHP